MPFYLAVCIISVKCVEPGQPAQTAQADLGKKFRIVFVVTCLVSYVMRGIYSSFMCYERHLFLFSLSMEYLNAKPFW